MSFEALKVKPHLVKALRELGIVKPTQIQKQAIPLVQSGRDVIGISKTGSGKTAAFGIPMLEQIAHSGQALVVVPTRELACQISDELRKFSRHQPCSIATVHGGISFAPQVRQIRNADIIVGTPGRLVDHLRQRTLSLSKANYVVLDEADKMVEMGFVNDIQTIMNHTPKCKQVLLFGATISEEIEQLKRSYMKNPIIVKTERHVKQEFLEQYYYNVEVYEKFSLLAHLLKMAQRAIVFCSRRSTVDVLTRNLRSHGIKAVSIHGKLNQSTRLKVVDDFRKGLVRVLVASAVAARGLDFKNVTHIFNYDLSRDPQEYIHRVGRTARAGECGKAITLLSPNNHSEFTSILSKYDVNVKVLQKGNFPRLHFAASRPRDHNYRPMRSHRGSRNQFRHRALQYT